MESKSEPSADGCATLVLLVVLGFIAYITMTVLVSLVSLVGRIDKIECKLHIPSEYNGFCEHQK